MPATDWKASTAANSDPSWAASDAPAHSLIEALELDDSITALHTAATDERHVAITFEFDLPAGATLAGFELKYEGGYGPVAGGGGPDSGTVFTLEFQLTKDGVTFIGDAKEVNVPEMVAAQTAGPVIIGGPTDLWGATFTEAEAEASTFGVSMRRGPSSDDDLGRANDIINGRWWYTVATVGDPPVTSLSQQRYLPGASVRGGPAGMRRG